MVKKITKKVVTGSKTTSFKNNFDVHNNVSFTRWEWLKILSPLFMSQGIPTPRKYSGGRKFKSLSSQAKLNFCSCCIQYHIGNMKNLFIYFFHFPPNKLCFARGNFHLDLCSQQIQLWQHYPTTFPFLSESLKIRLYFDNSCGWVSNSCQDIYWHLLFSSYRFVPSGSNSTGLKSRLNNITGPSKAISCCF